MTESLLRATTPEEVLSVLRKGNEEFAAGQYAEHDHLQAVKTTALGQYPKALILSCCDSRVPAATIFNQGIGDLFVARIAGNIATVNVLGSFEFGAAVAGAKALIVLGHTHCGAIKHAIDRTDVKSLNMENLAHLLGELDLAVETSLAPGQKRESNDARLRDAVTEKNVRITIGKIRSQSPILAELEKDGKLAITGGVYDIETGLIKWLAPSPEDLGDK